LPQPISKAKGPELFVKGDQTDRITIEAKPEPIQVDPLKAAVIVVDMQNAFAEKGGYFDLAGFDISATRGIIAPCRRIIDAARDRGTKIIYFQMGFSQDLSDKGAPDSPSSIKSRVLARLREHPEWRDKLYIYGTWGAEIIEELRAQKQDIVVKKQKYDGFMGTNLDIILRTLGIHTLFFIGTATNICVESTLRHAFFLDYSSVLVSDAVSPLGPALTQEATVLNVESTFGWVTSSDKILEALGS
jgi:ureidoacrylate peracid hydrolase